jgi:hypothetical protein
MAGHLRGWWEIGSNTPSIDQVRMGSPMALLGQREGELTRPAASDRSSLMGICSAPRMTVRSRTIRVISERELSVVSLTENSRNLVTTAESI